MDNSQRAGCQDDRAGTGWMRRWWTGEKLSVRLSEVVFVLVLAGALVWAGWFASVSQNATWTPVLVCGASGWSLCSRLMAIRADTGDAWAASI